MLLLMLSNHPLNSCYPTDPVEIAPRNAADIIYQSHNGFMVPVTPHSVRIEQSVNQSVTINLDVILMVGSNQYRY